MGARATGGPMRVAMVLPGLGRVQRGAEASFLELARRLARRADVAPPVLFGTGRAVPDGLPIHVVACRPREHFECWPRLPAFRTEYEYEEFTFAAALAASRLYRPADFDVVLNCSSPHVNWFLRWAGRGGRGPALVFVTQNGDWMCRAGTREYRYFGCDGLVCINPEFFDRNKQKYRSALIPNGVDPDFFRPPAPGEPAGGPELGDLGGRKLVVMAAALIDSKLVAEGLRAASRLPEVFVAVAGDGPLRGLIAEEARRSLPGRHALLGSIDRGLMPGLFRRADAFLHMSRDEPAGLVYFEAAATGLPMAVDDNAVTRWQLGDAAAYGDAREETSMADALRRALGPEGPSLGAGARRRVERDWSWEVIAGRYKDFFDEVVAARRAAAAGAR